MFAHDHQELHLLNEHDQECKWEIDNQKNDPQKENKVGEEQESDNADVAPNISL
jgi:hypothetical protein